MTTSTQGTSLPENGRSRRTKCLQLSKKFIKDRVPIIDWLPKYQWKHDFLRDFFCGFTLACIHVPQALAFSMLANVDLVYGLYTTCFTGIVYTLLGTAHISSFGPVAVGSMITGEAVEMASGEGYSNNEVASSLTFLIGLVYLIGFLLRFGVITIIFRKNFISPFIAGCTLHIIAKSLKLLLGLKIKNHYGLFNFPRNVHTFFEHIDETHYLTLGVSVVVLSIFIFNMLVLKPLIRRFTKIVLPIEALTMLLAALVSYLFNFQEKGVPVVGLVPSGLPTPSPPNWELFPLILSSAITTALINFSSSISMSFLFNKDVRAGQEMFAMAVTNLICANLQCITVGNSMMRTRVAVTLNLKTLMTTLVASLFMLMVILFLGPLFTPMPTAVLGCIIVLSTSLLLFDRVKEVVPLCRVSFDNAFLYVVTLTVTLFADVVFGLLVGGLLSLRLVLKEVPSEKPEESKGPEAEKLLSTNGKAEQIVPKSQSNLNV